MQRSKFGLVKQLLVGFAAGGVLVGGFLFVGNRMLDATSVRLQQTLDGHVRPLAQLHKLQSSIFFLQNGELELPHIADAYPMPIRVESMRSMIRTADANIDQIATQIKPQSPIEAERLLGHWQAYRSSLTTQITLAESMNQAALGALREEEITKVPVIPLLVMPDLIRHPCNWIHGLRIKSAMTTVYQQFLHP